MSGWNALKKGAGALAALLAVGATLAGCGSDDSDPPAANETTTTEEEPTFTGEPVKIALVAGLTGPNFPGPEHLTGAEAAVQSINAAGGAGGRKLELVVCDTEQNAGRSAACWRDLSNQPDVIAVIGSDAFKEASEDLIAEMAIPLVGIYPVGFQDLTSPTSFLTGGGVATEYSATALAVLREGAKKVSLMRPDIATAESIESTIKATVEGGGGTIGDIVKVSMTTTDMAAPAAQLLHSDPDAVVLVGGAAQLQPTIQALRQQGFKGLISFGATNLTRSFLPDLGVDTEGLIGITDLAPVITEEVVPEIEALREAVAKYQPGKEDGMSGSTTHSWSAIHLIASAIEDLDTVDRASLKAKLETLTSAKTGVTPPLDFTKPGPLPVIERVVNPYVAVMKANGTTWSWDGKMISATGPDVEPAPR